MANEEPGATESVDVFQAFSESRLADVHTSIPGKIVSYDAETERATVQPLVKLKRKVAGSILDIEIPPIENVPVVLFHTSSFKLKIPINEDDGCIIFFSEVGIGKFLTSTGAVVEADDLARFSLTDAYCVPGLWGNNAPSNTPTLEVTAEDELKLLDGSMVLTNTTIDLLGASESFTKGDSLETLLNNFFNALSTGIVPGTTPQNAASLTAIKVAATAALSQTSTIKSATIKGE